MAADVVRVVIGLEAGGGRGDALPEDEGAPDWDWACEATAWRSEEASW